MSHDYGWRDACAAGGVTDMVVGSSAWLGSVVLFINLVVSDDLKEAPIKCLLGI